jgi:hypothetical protein
MVRFVILLFVLPLVVGCADDAGDGALRVMRNTAVGDTCTVESSLTGLGRSLGTIEVNSPADYLLTPVIQNFASSASGKLISQRTAFLEGARIDLSFDKPDLFTAAELENLEATGVTKFSSPFSAAVAPDNGVSGVGFSIVPVELLKILAPKLGPAGSAVVNVRLKVFGKMGGGEVESETYFYPVTVCDGCVTGKFFFTCGAKGVTVRKGNACNPFQDGPVDCCTQNGALICPGVAGT